MLKNWNYFSNNKQTLFNNKQNYFFRKIYLDAKIDLIISKGIGEGASKTPNEEIGKVSSKEISKEQNKETNQKSAAVTEVAPAPALLQKKTNPTQEKLRSSSEAKLGLLVQRCKRKQISIPIKRRVYQNAGYQCEYLSPITGERCSETKFLTIDYVHPLALGGTNEESNLQTLCLSHNLAEARRMGLKRPQTLTST